MLGDQVEAAMERLVSDTVGHIPMPEIDDEDDDYDDYEDDDEEYIPHGAKPQKKREKAVRLSPLQLLLLLLWEAFSMEAKCSITRIISSTEQPSTE